MFFSTPGPTAVASATVEARQSSYRHLVLQRLPRLRSRPDHHPKLGTGRAMNTKLLIDAIVHQTTVLIAQLSTASGIRAPLSHVADQVFLELSREIEAQGVSRKVAADMFGLAIRTYQKKVQR